MSLDVDDAVLSTPGLRLFGFSEVRTYIDVGQASWLEEAERTPRYASESNSGMRAVQASVNAGAPRWVGSFNTG